MILFLFSYKNINLISSSYFSEDSVQEEDKSEQLLVKKPILEDFEVLSVYGFLFLTFIMILFRTLAAKANPIANLQVQVKQGYSN